MPAGVHVEGGECRCFAGARPFAGELPQPGAAAMRMIFRNPPVAIRLFPPPVNISRRLTEADRPRP